VTARCDASCPACGGAGYVTRTARLAVGGAPVATTTYTTECPRAVARDLFAPRAKREIGIRP
jgi:hypothetical protein